jgi:dienelactone hydrolase
VKSARFAFAAVLGVTIILPAGAGNAHAQGAARTPLDSPEFARAATEPFWRSLSTLGCAALNPPRNGRGGAPSVAAVQHDFDRRVGTVPATEGGFVLGRRTVTRVGAVTVEEVRTTSRLGHAAVFGYHLIPAGGQRGPAVIVIPAAGVAAGELVGWRLPGDSVIALRDGNHPTAGAAMQLARMGFTVFVPYLGFDHQFFPWLPWLTLERLGISSALATGRGNTYSVLLPLLSGVVDFLEGQPSVDPRRIGAMGWEEGGLLAGWLAAYDRRISAVGIQTAPLDRAALRRSPELARHGAAFTQMDCVLGDAELASLVSPRPLMFSDDVDDSTSKRLARFATPAAEARVREAYAAAGGRHLTVHRVARGTGARESLATWLATTLAAPVVQPPTAVRLDAPSGARVSTANFDVRNAQIAATLSLAGRCEQWSVDRVDLERNFELVQRGLRRRLAARLGIPQGLQGMAMSVTRRDTLPGTPTIRLEWVVATGNAGVTSVVTGILGTPRNRSGPFPAVLSLDGYTKLSSVFGVSPAGNTEYLNSYGAELVAAGYAVFVPFVPVEFPEYSTAVAVARGLRTPGSWATMLPYFAGARGILRVLPETSGQPITAYGISYAGVAAMLLTALDPTIDALVYSNPVQTLDRLFSSPTAPLLATWWSELCDAQDVVQRYLLVPRPFIWENGERDANTSSSLQESPVARIADVYRARGAAGNFRFLRHGGGHETRFHEWRGLITSLLPNKNGR